MTPKERKFVVDFFGLRPLTDEQADKSIEEFLDMMTTTPDLTTRKFANKLKQEMAQKGGPTSTRPDPNWMIKNNGLDMRARAELLLERGELGTESLVTDVAPPAGEPTGCGRRRKPGSPSSEFRCPARR